MKISNECPKCASKNILKGKSRNDMVDVPYKDGSGGTNYPIDYYMCDDCGYIESWKRTE